MPRALLMLAGMLLLLSAGLAMDAHESEAGTRAATNACTTASDQAALDHAFLTGSPQLNWSPEAARRDQLLPLCSGKGREQACYCG